MEEGEVTKRKRVGAASIYRITYLESSPRTGYPKGKLEILGFPANVYKGIRG